MVKPLLDFRSRLVSHEREALDSSRLLTCAIRGFIMSNAIPLSSAPIRTTVKYGLPSQLTLISRLSCRRAGTRFNSRGIDDDGNVANFVESETILWNSGTCFSYVQVRGSVPVFWEQATGLLPGQQKISITRSKEGTQPAFDKHFHDLEQSYGAVHVVNLLAEAKPAEADLTAAYRYGIRHSYLMQNDGDNSKDHQLLRETLYDFHAETRERGYDAAKYIRPLIEESADGFAYYLSEEVDDSDDNTGSTGKKRIRSVVVLQQEGVFRTNCLDCLDRTNLIQGIISQMALESFLGHRGERLAPDFKIRHSSLWADNGDALSKTYAGTGALKSSFTRHGKMSIAGAIADARKSATRLYVNNVLDKGRQSTMDELLGRLVGQAPIHLYDPINDYVTAELNKRSSEYSSTKVANIWVGTYNLNGRTDGVDQDLSDWLFPKVNGSELPEIVVVGFQEIVELNPQQIMNSDPTVKHAWEKALKRQLNARAKAVGSEEYVLLRSGQLVGAALLIYVQNSVLKNIKNVEGNIKKTGMSGMAGNKGAVAIRMDYANTQICFVTAHLAAGFANYDERNKDYQTISQGLRFQRNRGVEDHDTVIWLGDFNYRIGKNNEIVRDLISKGDLETLYENDQLNIQMVHGLTFRHYNESKINFPPTYRYDIGYDLYDTSDKARIPAWTDRILWKGNNLRQTAYGAAQSLRFSDHRPVYGVFQCTISIIDIAAREKLSRELYAKRRTDVGNAVASTHNEDTEDEDLIGYDSMEPGLPPASSDRRKWWLDNGAPARSTVKPPQRGAQLNPNRPANPFTPNEESDWVTVSMPLSPRSESAETLASFKTAPVALPPRKLPPQWDPHTRSLVDQNGAPLKERCSPEIPEQVAALKKSLASKPVSTYTPSFVKKAKSPPPPIGKKPTHLTSSPTLSPRSPALDRPGANDAAPRQSPRSMSGVQTVFPPPPRRATGPPGAGDLGQTLAAPKPRRTGTAATAPPERQNWGRPEASVAPRLPTRTRQPATVQDLLGDDAGDENSLGGWEVLRPMS